MPHDVATKGIGNTVVTSVDRAMIDALGEVSEDEIRDPKVHARRCGPRFTLLAAMCLENGEQGQRNADALGRAEKRLLLAVLGSTLVVGSMVLGKERGIEAVMTVAKALFL